LNSNGTAVVKQPEPNVTSIVKQLGPNALGIVKNPISLSDRLMKMAEYHKISATTCMVRVSPNIYNNSTEIVGGHTQQSFDREMERPLAKKIYVPFYVNDVRIIGCMDSGSDITIMHESMYERMLTLTDPVRPPKMLPSKIPYLTTFSDTQVTIIGMCGMWLKPASRAFPVRVDVYIVPDIPNVPVLLIGNDVFKSGLVTLSYTGDTSDPYPEIIFNYGAKTICTVYYEPFINLFNCHATCDLKPNEEQDVIFYLPKIAPVIRNDHILITSRNWDDIIIVPSRSDIEIISGTDCYIACARVTNIGVTHFSGEIIGKYELVNKALIINLEETNYGNVKKTLSTYPLARELLLTNGINNREYYPYFTANQVNVPTTANVNISDLDSADIIMGKEPTYTGEVNMEPELFEAKGLELPTMIYGSASEAIDLNAFPEEIRPFIKDIFIDKYPEVVSLHSLDAGNLSLTLGYTQLRLREGETLPRSRRIFHISPNDTRHLEDICDLLIKYGFIKKSDLQPNGCHLYGMSAYLVPRAKPNCLGRLIIDYSPVNQLIQSPSAVIPEIEATLQFLQGKALFTSLDLRYAYLGLRIDEESRKLTTFITPTGTYEWLALPTGAANSPAYFTDACNRMLHFEPEYDSDGNVIYESKNVVKQKASPLKLVCNYFDDILCTSTLKPTYQETLQAHFKIVEQCIKRLAFHGSRVNVPKCEFAKSKILFLGWYVSHDYVIADPRRIQKVKDFKFPDSKKAVRAFLGLVNSLRRVIPMDVIEQVSLLTPLTSSRAEFIITEKHKEAFKQIKEMLTQEPIFCNLINEKAEKYLWVDAATSSGVVGAVLAQRITKDDCEKDAKIVPTCLDLDDPVHRIIFDKALPYEPVQLYTSQPIVVPTPSVRKTKPPVIKKHEALLGYTNDNVNDSFFWSTLSTLALHNSTSKMVLTPEMLRKKAVKRVKEGVLDNKLRDFIFNLNRDDYRNFINDFLSGKVGLDSEYILADALAKDLSRPIILVSSLKRHEKQPIIKFNSQSTRPPLVYGIYQRDKHEIFLPFCQNREVEFKLANLKNKVQIIAYVAKTVPEAARVKCILDLEALALINALGSLHRYISNVPVKLLTDSKVLYYMFNPTIGSSSVKVKRWCLKLISDYPNIVIRHVSTTENLADFLTREGLPPGDLPKFNIKNVQILDFAHALPKEEFTFVEWINFVEANPQFLQTDSIAPITMAINKGIENIQEVLKPIDILREKLSRHIIIRCQKTEFAEIYAQCLASDNFEYVPAETNDSSLPTYVKYKLAADLLLIYKQHYRIYIPPSLVGCLLSYTHLLGHKGTVRMIADLQSYYFKNMYTLTRELVQSCWSCFLTNKGTRHTKLGTYKSPDYPMQEISMDLAENLNTVNGYSHLLIIQCALTDFILIYPLKSKQADYVTTVLLYNVLQPFNVQRIHSDNGPCFRSRNWLELMAALNITVIASAALHPQGRGSIERQIGIVKQTLKKLLATHKTLDWEYLPLIVAKIINNNVSPRTGFKPQEMVFGSVENQSSFLNLQHIAHPHYLVRSNTQRIADITAEVQEMAAIATDKYVESKKLILEYQNKNRVERNFKKDDYVFVLDRMQVPGNTRPLKTKFHPSPYVVVEPRHTTTRVKRLADGFESVYGNADLKKFDSTSPLFAQVPPEVSRVLVHGFKNLLHDDLCTIMKYDTLDGPLGETLMNLEEDDEPQTIDNLEKELTPNDRLDVIAEKDEQDPLTQQLENPTVNNPPTFKLKEVRVQLKNILKDKDSLPINPDGVNLNKLPPAKMQTRSQAAKEKLQNNEGDNKQTDHKSDSEEEDENNSNGVINTHKRKVYFDPNN